MVVDRAVVACAGGDELEERRNPVPSLSARPRVSLGKPGRPQRTAASSPAGRRRTGLRSCHGTKPAATRATWSMYGHISTAQAGEPCDESRLSRVPGQGSGPLACSWPMRYLGIASPMGEPGGEGGKRGDNGGADRVRRPHAIRPRVRLRADVGPAPHGCWPRGGFGLAGRAGASGRGLPSRRSLLSALRSPGA